jgi:hypothetical protein
VCIINYRYGSCVNIRDDVSSSSNPLLFMQRNRSVYKIELFRLSGLLKISPASRTTSLHLCTVFVAHCTQRISLLCELYNFYSLSIDVS